jgi:hypothetical protein
MGDKSSDPNVGGAAYFNLLAEKLRSASQEICKACDNDVPPEARPDPTRCGPADCVAKRVLRAADNLERDLDKEDGSAA